MLRTGFTLSWMAFLTITAASQQPVVKAEQPEELKGLNRSYVSFPSQHPVVEPGRPQELKGVTRIHVSAASNDARNNIIGEIRKRLPQLTITERSEEAEVWLLFSIAQRSFPKADPTSGLGSNSSGTSIEYELVASGAIIKPVTSETARRLMEFQESTETTMSFPEKALSTKFAKAFVKTYRKANL
jgi:hypothetical protein